MSVTNVNAVALRGWREELEAAGRAAGTIGVRLSHVRRALGEIGKPVADVTRRDLVRWLAAGDWSPATRRSIRSSLRSFFAWYAAEHGQGESVAATLPIVAAPRSLPRPASDVDVMDAIQSAEPWVSLAIEVMATCGLRRGECARLRADDVTPVGQGWTLRVVGKGGHERVVPCPPHLARALRARRGWIFPGGDGGHVSPGWLGKRVSAVLGPGLTAHTLRHRFASVAYAHSHDLRAVQVLLGHASVATTQIYTAVDDVSAREAAVSAWRIVA
ncbi:tyrosine-type recombinase/integrase [Corynebacterium sanguinis]|uniref:tyrosine-type recombinase/integrase n=1 Tax=Corynebacterium sanguinis TaxID=2594913 RepID=UPI0021A8B6F8|nr:tyrosine-type recombinase/integrase [Corynebacterium sanguinis]MCT1804378.1 tyrosine-type recombinase/integrase [Corynebacterium sanguinis]